MVLLLILISFVVLISNDKIRSRIFRDVESSSDTLIVRDTVIQVKDSIIYKQPIIRNILPSNPPDSQDYKVDTSYEILKERFKKLVAEHTVSNLYNDTIKIDSNSYFTVTDTVYMNKILGRSYTYSVQYEHITETKTYPRDYNFFALGGAVNTNSAHLGFLYKNKKDLLMGAHGGSTFTGNPYVGIQVYVPLKRK